ncbi:MAG: hypothetical protein ACLP4W_04005 [Mycobacterium sp.]|uniref:hypothetical protein n=1 Tax=Mycobacterium sp. TaxID=1785 RepID=UPI003F99E180
MTAGIAAVTVALSLLGCSPSRPNATRSTPAASATTSTANLHPGFSSAQVVLPFGDYINHLAGVAVDAAHNVYALDSYYGQAWKLAAGAKRPTTLSFTRLGQPVQVGVDAWGTLYVVDELNFRVLKLAAR